VEQRGSYLGILREVKENLTLGPNSDDFVMAAKRQEELLDPWNRPAQSFEVRNFSSYQSHGLFSMRFGENLMYLADKIKLA
jgi:hypothetical protein